ncbi:MAG: transporter substrate-binding domain-containing protein [Alphaproteobacteria bacterium]|nr:transporter substrate-binding domain-containing protein [Alphaproteobacteria bacterium]
MKVGYLTLLITATMGLGFAAMRHTTLGTRTHTETALERIERTRTIRCGYVVSEPYLLRDPNTGSFSGIAFDYMSALAKELDVKVVWTEETGWGSFHEGLNAGKFDVMCVPVYQSGARARIALLSQAVFYTGLYVTERADSSRFATIESINKPNVRIKIVDNATLAVKQRLFPQAQEDLAIQAVDETQLYLDVAFKRADIGFGNPGGLRRFNAHSDVKLKLALSGKPVRLYGTSLAVKRAETDLKNTLDSTIAALNASGEAASIVKAYAPDFQTAAELPYTNPRMKASNQVTSGCEEGSSHRTDLNKAPVRQEACEAQSE